MSTWNSTKIVFYSLLIIVINLIFSVSLFAQPPQPSGYFGNITVDGNPASIGTEISAWINGVNYPTNFITQNIGQYGLMSINGDDPGTPGKEGGINGETVNFKVTVDGETYDASPSSVWESGANHEVNLVVTTGPSSGIIQVTTNLPQATFTLTGPTTYTGSDTSWTQTEAPPGMYTISYGVVAGYTKPADEMKTLSVGDSITFVGNYVIIGNQLTIKIDMESEMHSGRFNPDSGEVMLIGDFNEWELGKIKLARLNELSIYSTILTEFTASPGDTIYYKYAYSINSSIISEGVPNLIQPYTDHQPFLQINKSRCTLCHSGYPSSYQKSSPVRYFIYGTDTLLFAQSYYRPEKIVLVYPPVGSTISNLKPTFKWNPTPNTSKYKIFIYDSGGHEALTELTTLSEFVPNVTLGENRYNWNIFDYNTYGLVRSSSEMRYFTISGVVSVDTTRFTESVPKTFALLQNYPNPFNPKTTITYGIPESHRKRSIKIEIYNILGEKVRTLLDKPHSAGYHEVQWNGKDDLGLVVSGGTYIYRLIVGPFVEEKTMVLLK